MGGEHHPGIASVFPQCCSCVLFLSHRAPVSAAALLSDDVPSEDCLWRGERKDIWIISYHDSGRCYLPQMSISFRTIWVLCEECK